MEVTPKMLKRRDWLKETLVKLDAVENKDDHWRFVKKTLVAN